MITMEQVRVNLRKARILRGMTQEELGRLIGKSRNTVQGYEAGASEIPLSSVLAMADALRMDVWDLLGGGTPQDPGAVAEIRVYSLEDRLQVAGILIKNGYKVGQAKSPRPGGKKQNDYFLTIEDDQGCLDSRG